jgi:tRNA(Ile)-lysidine synthetase-like protein
MFSDFPNLEIQWNALERRLSEDFRGVVLGCSGGLDSTALLALFCEIRNSKKNFELAAFHINYGLRGAASDADQAHIEALCATLAVPLRVRRVTPAEHDARQGEGVQEWARRLRREVSAEYAAAGWIVALAHHLDDVAENVLLRLARGVAPVRLGGLSPFEPPFWRPLLGERKATLAAYLTRRGIAHREDASNATLDYSRNVIRHRIIPELERLFSGAAEHIAACALDAEDLGIWCDAAVTREAVQHAGNERPWLASLPRGAARHALATLIRTGAPGHRQLSRRFLDEVLDAMTLTAFNGRPATWARDLPRGGRVVLNGNGLAVEASPHAGARWGADFEALLGSGSHALISLGSATYRLDGALSPSVAKVYGTLAAKP